MTPAPVGHRTLESFGPLRRAERLFLRACANGEIARVGLQRPHWPTIDISLRADFLAWALRGGVQLPLRRVQLLGAWIEGRLDLSTARIPASLWFYRCMFDETPQFDGARIDGSLSFPDSLLPGLMGERLQVGDDLALNAGCTVAGELRLRRARIGGRLDARRLRLQDGSHGGGLLVAERAEIGGDVDLSGGAESAGLLAFVQARIGGDFSCAGARLTAALDARGTRGAALVLDRAEIAGSLRLHQGFAAAGAVSIRRARIGGDLDGSDAAFDRAGDASWGNGAPLAIEHSRVGGTLSLQRLSAPLVEASFAGTRAMALADDVSTWGERLVLDGFRYGRLADGAPRDAAFRVGWLVRQRADHLGEQFRLHPWQRLIKVLRRMGEPGSAASVTEHRELRLRAAGRIGAAAPGAVRWLPRTAHAVFGALAGYGTRLHRLAGASVAVWLGCAAAYAVAGAASPLATSLRWLVPGLGAGAPVLPAGDGGLGLALHALAWAEAGFGAVALLLLLVSLSGWLDRARGA